MKQSNAIVSSRSAADFKHGVRQQRKPCHQSSDSFLVYDQVTVILDERSDDRKGMSETDVNRLAM